VNSQPLGTAPLGTAPFGTADSDLYRSATGDVHVHTDVHPSIKKLYDLLAHVPNTGLNCSKAPSYISGVSSPAPSFMLIKYVS